VSCGLVELPFPVYERGLCGANFLTFEGKSADPMPLRQAVGRFSSLAAERLGRTDPPVALKGRDGGLPLLLVEILDSVVETWPLAPTSL
jgi:hypothetical protein